MTQYPRLADRLRSALTTHGRRPAQARPQRRPADPGEEFAERLRQALPERPKRPRITSLSDL